MEENYGVSTDGQRAHPETKTLRDRNRNNHCHPHIGLEVGAFIGARRKGILPAINRMVLARMVLARMVLAVVALAISTTALDHKQIADPLRQAPSWSRSMPEEGR
jgi:hypothetical protein